MPLAAPTVPAASALIVILVGKAMICFVGRICEAITHQSLNQHVPARSSASGYPFLLREPQKVSGWDQIRWTGRLAGLHHRQAAGPSVRMLLRSWHILMQSEIRHSICVLMLFIPYASAYW